MLAPEITRFVPRPGRTPPARLQVVPNPFEETEGTVCVKPTGRLGWKDIAQLRGEVPAAPKSRGPKPKAPKPFVPPYLQPDYWKGEPKLGHALHEQMRRDMGRGAAIRPCPSNLGKLLNTPEWKGAQIVGTVPSPEIGKAEADFNASRARCSEAENEVRELCERIGKATADGMDKVASTLRDSLHRAEAALAQRLKTLGECQTRLDLVRSEEWTLVRHPSGAELRVRPGGRSE